MGAPRGDITKIEGIEFELAQERQAKEELAKSLRNVKLELEQERQDRALSASEVIDADCMETELAQEPQVSQLVTDTAEQGEAYIDIDKYGHESQMGSFDLLPKLRSMTDTAELR